MPTFLPMMPLTIRLLTFLPERLDLESTPAADRASSARRRLRRGLEDVDQPLVGPISNCSRDFLSTWGERFTVHLFLSSGADRPGRRAPVRFAGFHISAVDWSSTGSRSLEPDADLVAECCRIAASHSGFGFGARARKIPSPESESRVPVFMPVSPSPSRRRPSGRPRGSRTRPFSIATGVISSAVMSVLSPGMSHLHASPRYIDPVTSVVRR